MSEMREPDLTSVKFAIGDMRLIASRQLKGRLDAGRRGAPPQTRDSAVLASLRTGSVRRWIILISH